MALHRCHGRGTYSANHIDSQLPREARRRRRQRCQSVVHVKTKSPAPRTMESVRSAFHAQLATVMDSLLAAAVCEIAKIFESSLCEQQAELAQKAEEISILRGKLEKVERRQKPRGSGSEEGEMSSGDREGILKQQRPTLSGRSQVLNFINTEFHYWTDSGGFTPSLLIGLNVETDASSHSDTVEEGVSESLSGLKQEVTGQDGTSVKHEVRTCPVFAWFKSWLSNKKKKKESKSLLFVKGWHKTCIMLCGWLFLYTSVADLFSFLFTAGWTTACPRIHLGLRGKPCYHGAATDGYPVCPTIQGQV